MVAPSGKLCGHCKHGLGCSYTLCASHGEVCDSCPCPDRCTHCGEPISLGNMGSMCGKRTPSAPCEPPASVLDGMMEALKLIKGEPTPVRAILAEGVQFVAIADEKLAKDGPVMGKIDVVSCNFLPEGFQMVQWSDGSLTIRTKNGSTFKIPAPKSAGFTKLDIPMPGRGPGW